MWTVVCLFKYKGIDIAIEAYKILLMKVLTDIKWYVFEDGEEKDNFEKVNINFSF